MNPQGPKFADFEQKSWAIAHGFEQVAPNALKRPRQACKWFCESCFFFVGPVRNLSLLEKYVDTGHSIGSKLFIICSLYLREHTNIDLPNFAAVFAQISCFDRFLQKSTNFKQRVLLKSVERNSSQLFASLHHSNVGCALLLYEHSCEFVTFFIFPLKILYSSPPLQGLEHAQLSIPRVGESWKDCAKCNPR